MCVKPRFPHQSGRGASVHDNQGGKLRCNRTHFADGCGDMESGLGVRNFRCRTLVPVNGFSFLPRKVIATRRAREQLVGGTQRFRQLVGGTQRERIRQRSGPLRGFVNRVACMFIGRMLPAMRPGFFEFAVGFFIGQTGLPAVNRRVTRGTLGGGRGEGTIRYIGKEGEGSLPAPSRFRQDPTHGEIHIIDVAKVGSTAVRPNFLFASESFAVSIN